VSRSLHTDPYRVRSARRVAAPYRRRGDEPRAVRRRDRSDVTAPGAGGPAVRVDVRVCPARPGFHHPAGGAEILRVLASFGSAVVYGVRRIELRQRTGAGPAGLAVAVLREPGMVVLFEQPRPPWTVVGQLNAEAEHRLRRAGAIVHAGPAVTRVDWPGRTLTDFMLFDGLMHEIGHHIVQRRAGRRGVRAMRTADHERRADAFAMACRLAMA
jgi:hypothetical protein